MKIAILGSGLAGLAVCFHALEHPNVEATVFDPVGIGGKASKVSAGLLHSWAGLRVKKSPRAEEGIAETLKLIRASQEALKETVAVKTGSFRQALSDEQKRDYSKAALNKEIIWKEACQEAPFLSPHPGIFIPDTWQIDTHAYLEGLWKACELKGARFEQRKIDSLDELADFDHIFCCLGADTTSLPELKEIPVNRLKGQVLELESTLQLPFPLNSTIYLLNKGRSLLLGATYERDFTDELPNIERAKIEMLPKLIAMIPSMEGVKVIGCKAAFRATTQSKLPVLMSLSPRVHVFAGLGSKGLLYHALYAKELLQRINFCFCN